MPVTDARPTSLDWAAVRAAAVTTLDQLGEISGHPKSTSVDKESTTMTPLEVAFVEASSFFLLATSSPDGTCDVSPRGDPAGSVLVVDARTLVLADRRVTSGSIRCGISFRTRMPGCCSWCRGSGRH